MVDPDRRAVEFRTMGSKYSTEVFSAGVSAPQQYRGSFIAKGFFCSDDVILLLFPKMDFERQEFQLSHRFFFNRLITIMSGQGYDCSYMN